MIPKDEYIQSGGHSPFDCITFELVKKYHTEKDVKKFGDFICGQTGCVLPNGEFGIYSHDYERWIKEGMRNRQMPHTWD